MDIEELKERYAAGDRDFSGVDLSGLSLMYIHLSDADFSNANLRSANLAGANLSNTDFNSSNLQFVNLNRAILSHANLRNANLESATILGANLEEANLGNVNLKNTYLDRANLKNANLNEADLTNAELISADLSGVDLENTISAVTVANLYQPSENNPDLELLSFIKESSNELWFVLSEGYALYEVFLWDVNKQGEFTIDRLIQVIGHPNYSYPNRRNIQEIPDKEDLKIAFFKELEPKPEEPLIIDGIEYEIIENPPKPYSKPELDFSDDYVFECEIYSKYELFDYFFGYVFCDGGRFEDDNFIDEYSNFARVVTDNLRNITVFRLGETKVHVYLVGQTNNANWIGIHTISIET